MAQTMAETRRVRGGTWTFSCVVSEQGNDKAPDCRIFAGHRVRRGLEEDRPRQKG